jgi:hypothetical protein
MGLQRVAFYAAPNGAWLVGSAILPINMSRLTALQRKL